MASVRSVNAKSASWFARDQERNIRFTDVTSLDFEAADYRFDHQDFMKEIQGRLLSGD